LSQAFAGLDRWAARTQQGESSNDDYDKFRLPTGSGFIEDILEFGPRRLVTDAQFDRSGPKCFSGYELKGQSGFGWGQPEATPQQINGLVHVRACHL
jgi:hypothetical protein